MKKIFLLLMLALLFWALPAHAVTYAFIEQYVGGEGTGPNMVIGAYYRVADSTAQTFKGSSVWPEVPIDQPNTWKNTVINAIIADAATWGYTLPATNIRWLVFEPGDYKEPKVGAAWTKDATKTNISSTYVNVYTGLYGELQGVNFNNGYTEYRLNIFVNKIGTGTQDAVLVDNANSANIMALSDTGAAGEHMLDSGWTALPSWAAGIVNLKPMARSTLTTDDPVYRQFVLYLR